MLLFQELLALTSKGLEAKMTMIRAVGIDPPFLGALRKRGGLSERSVDQALNRGDFSQKGR
jgi:hypothetical protein